MIGAAIYYIGAATSFGMGVLGFLSPLWWMVIFTLVFVTYTVLGGQHAIIRTDTLQVNGAVFYYDYTAVGAPRQYEVDFTLRF